MNYYGTETTEQHLIAGRIIPLIEAMWQAMQRATGRPLSEAKYAAVLPCWIHNLCDKLMTTIFKKLIKVAPRNNQVVARDCGQMTGFLLRGAVLIYTEFPLMLKREGFSDLSEVQEGRLKEISGLPMLLSVAGEFFQKPISNENELIGATTESVRAKARELTGCFHAIVKYLLERPVEEQYEFLQGVPEGFKAFLDLQGDFTGNKRRIDIYFALMRYWPEIAEMQKAQPPRTRKYLLEWLEKQEEKPLVTDPKQFYEVCDEIDLDLAPPGHPSNSSSN